MHVARKGVQKVRIISKVLLVLCVGISTLLTLDKPGLTICHLIYTPFGHIVHIQYGDLLFGIKTNVYFV